MKIEKWMDAVSTVEDDILEAFVKKDMQLTKQATRYRNPIIRKLRKWTPAIAACLCITICLGVVLQLVSNHSSKYLGKVNLVDRWSNPAEGMYLIQNPIITSSFQTSTTYQYGFTGGIAVAAKIIEILPDPYLKSNTVQYNPTTEQASVNCSYVIHFEVIETICGYNVPSDFYYLMLGDLAPSFSTYDIIVLEMQQLGMENYLLYNAATNQFERFPSMFTFFNAFPEFGSFLPFRNGIFCTDLWQEDGWSKRSYITDEEYDAFPFKKGQSYEYIKSEILKIFEKELVKSNNQSVVTVLTDTDFQTNEQKEALAYIEPFENGIFVKTRSNLGYIQAGGYKRHKLTIRRIINGFSTNEIITFTNSGEVVYEGERFTQEDLERLPALEELFDFLQAQTLLPENAEEYLQNEHHSAILEGQYVKSNGKIYGYVAVRFFKNASPFDTHHYILLENGRFLQVTEEELSLYFDKSEIT